jgi:hypothetical protein
MKTFKISLALLMLFSMAAAAQSDSRASFAAIKSLQGAWVGRNPKGQSLEVSFRTTSGGSAVMSEIRSPEEDMISMFHMDGKRLLMTHYCAAGNQPRMQAQASPDGKTLTFEFVDATNLDSPDAGHMQRMVLTMIDENHHTEDWTFVNHGKEMHEHFDLQRKS